ncbi:hypothetical protein O181_036780 [Austropuccinia psidii MF-1]|uniref:Uncharacterized protein n=1 Tax=Austropuccinia psidii MF-1 TaxID=1389203 RepID=A0A9Q3HCH6_9BASI|nr:hypothetical protein [Austropuccinia psidii MF-1]
MVHREEGNPWWKSQIIQKYRNGTWIWQTTMSFKNDKYSVDKDPYEWCLRQSKILEAIDPQMNIQMRNHKLLTQIPGELEHEVKCRCNQSLTLDEIENILQFLSERTNIGEYSQFRSSSFKEKQPFRGLQRQTQRKNGRSDQKETYVSQLWFNRLLCQ